MSKGEWKLHGGLLVPPQVRDTVWVEVVYRDGTRCKSDDFMHNDLWKWEKDGGPKDILTWRLM